MTGNSLLVFLHMHSGVIFVTLLVSLAILGTIYWYLRNKQDISESVPVEKPKTSKVASLSPPATFKARQEGAVAPQSMDKGGTTSAELFSLAEKLKKIRQSAKNSELMDDVKQSFHHIIDAGKSALAVRQWDRAKKYFDEAGKLSPNNPEIGVNLAIACYELGDLTESERHYQAACQHHSLAGKVFRKHLALRL